MKVAKIADIVDRALFFTANNVIKEREIAAILTNLSQVTDPNPDFAWDFEIVIGEGSRARSVKVPLQIVVSTHDSNDTPVFIDSNRLIYFRDRLFAAERDPRTNTEREELILRVKKACYEEDNELASLRAVVANYEAAIGFSHSGSRRDAIPDDVKLVVWARDGGACVRCGSKQNLHFDHVIPVAKGGGNTAENIQILCQPCNLRKSDKIAAT